jgi:hypothetical protein
MSSTSKNNKKSFLLRLKEKWGITGTTQIILILIVFSLAGSTAVALRQTYFSWLGFGEETSFWLKTFAYILFLFPAYQVLLLAYGFLLGQFQFFWQKELKMVNAIRRQFIR